MAEDELSIAGGHAQVLKQRGGGVPQMVDLDDAEAMS
jgi:hypothetical protein